ncbi:hypothetical protein MSAN_01333500 [Mycena sanguinolenta]|uniref:Uncharacterized protein n=1 Tax=Mycena sanguinolenta TaxID=230812 RepID=A0A8H6YAF6_9AGAR|nr:hypothetical protein MSAN_01333500 [Mycena sanguinolenta]
MTSISPSLSSSHSTSSLSVHSVANTVTSSVPLTAAYRPPPKDYAAAFAKLQGQYGMTMSDNFPGRVIPKKEKKRKSPPGRTSTPPSQGPSPISQSTSAIADSIHRTRSLDERRDSRRSSSSDRPSAVAGTSKARATDDGSASVEEAPTSKPSSVSKLRKLLGLRPKRNK